MPKNTMYKVGQKLRFIGKTLKYSVWTQGKIYEIHSISDEFHIEYHIIRDDGKMGLWWEDEMKKKFISLKKERKKKLKKLSNLD